MDEIIIVLKDVGPGIKDIDKAMEARLFHRPPTISVRWALAQALGLPNMKKCSDEMKSRHEDRRRHDGDAGDQASRIGKMAWYRRKGRNLWTSFFILCIW